jgi:GNAT superfamily N-acetyltransferase
MRIERLADRHGLATFECGTKALDDWLRNHAHENAMRNLSRTFVLVDDGDVVVGYYTLSMGGIRRESLPHKLGRGLPLYEIGMVLLARLAIASGYQGQGYGRDLLIAAVEEAAAAGQHAAARFIAVDPIDENARRFYAKFGFIDIRGDAGERMFMRIDQAIATFTEPR